MEIKIGDKFGRDCWIVPGVLIKNHVIIGNNVLIGMGVNVLKDVPR